MSISYSLNTLFPTIYIYIYIYICMYMYVCIYRFNLVQNCHQPRSLSGIKCRCFCTKNCKFHIQKSQIQIARKFCKKKLINFGRKCDHLRILYKIKFRRFSLKNLTFHFQKSLIQIAKRFHGKPKTKKIDLILDQNASSLYQPIILSKIKIIVFPQKLVHGIFRCLRSKQERYIYIYIRFNFGLKCIRPLMYKNFA